MVRTRSRALTVVPASASDIEAIAQRCRKTVTKRALLSATAAVVPIPGIDLAVDVGMIMKMLQQINTAFGLTPEQIDLLAPRRRLSAYKAMAAVGSTVVGRAITREAVSIVLKGVAKRMVAKSTTRYVPLVGQAIAATLSFAALKYIGQQHIDDCVAVSRQVVGGKGKRR